MDRNALARNLLIAGLVLVFGYFGIDKFVHPILWIGWVPPWMEGLLGLPRKTWLSVIGTIEIFSAILLMIPRRTLRRVAVALMIIQLAGILTQVGWNDIAVRDIGILAMGAALWLLI